MSRRKIKPSSKRIVKITIPEFITHLPYSKTKFKKINGQSVYAGMNKFVRATIMRKMHEYLEKHIPTGMKFSGPIRTSLQMHAPINYGTIRGSYNADLKQLVLNWKSPEPNYVPNWDADNQWIWLKAFNDTLVHMGIISDDNVSIVQISGEVSFFPVSTLDERKLVFIIEEL
jgi:hypothetical protein